MKPSSVFVAVILVCLFVTSCSGNLTRSKAEDLIRSKVTFPTDGEKDELYLYWGSYCFNEHHLQGQCGPEYMTERVKALQSAGVVTVTYEGDSSRLALTAKGQQYALGAPSVRAGNNGNGETTPLSTVNVVKSKVDFGTITGIIQADESKSASVEYTLIVTPTPFGIADGLTLKTVKQTASFKKYDDGWRISR